MKMRFALLLLVGLLPSWANAADAVLRTSDRATYDASLIEVAREMGETDAQKVLVAIAAYAVGKAEDSKQQTKHFLAEAAYLKQHPDEFLRRIAPLEGLTGQEILEAEPPVRPTSH